MPGVVWKGCFSYFLPLFPSSLLHLLYFVLLSQRFVQVMVSYCLLSGSLKLAWPYCWNVNMTEVVQQCSTKLAASLLIKWRVIISYFGFSCVFQVHWQPPLLLPSNQGSSGFLSPALILFPSPLTINSHYSNHYPERRFRVVSGLCHLQGEKKVWFAVN